VEWAEVAMAAMASRVRMGAMHRGLLASQAMEVMAEAEEMAGRAERALEAMLLAEADLVVEFTALEI